MSRDFALVIIGVRILPDCEIPVACSSGGKGYRNRWNSVWGAEEATRDLDALERVAVTVRKLRDFPLRMHQRDAPVDQDS